MNRSLSLVLITIFFTAKSLVAQVPTITSVTPERGLLGIPFSIAGSNFDPVFPNNIVYLGATRAIVVGGSATQLNILSAVSSYQPITVTVNGLTGYSTRPYLPMFPSPPFGPNSLKGRVDFSNISVHALVVKDFDNDAKVDIAVVDWGAAGLRIFKNNSTVGTPSFSAALTKTGAGASGLCAGDLNGDGKQDIVTANYNDDKISIFINTSSNNNISFADAITYPTGINPYRVATGDFNNDGKPDIVVTCESASAKYISVFENDTPVGGPLAFKAAKDFATQPTPRGVEVSDIDMDGKADIIVTCQSGYLSVFKNISTANNIDFAGSMIINLPSGSSPESSVIADFDGDLKLDIAVANNQSNNVSVFKSTSSPGNLSFAPRQEFATGQWNFNISVGDFDWDGKPDLVVTNQGDNSASVLINNSAANSISFNNKIDFPVGNWPRTSAIADVDGDFRPDLIVGNNSGNSVSVLLGNIQKAQAVINFPVPVQPDIGPDNILNTGATSNNTETPIVYTSSNPAVAYIRADGQIQVIAPGTTTITANQPESTNFLAATPVSRTYVIKQYQSVSFPAISPKITCDPDFPANATSTTPQPLFYSSSNPAVATVSSLGIIHITGAGTTTITVTQPGNNLYYDAAPVSRVLTVNTPTSPVVTVSANNNSVCSGSPVIFTAAATNAGSDPTYEWLVNGSPSGANSPELTVNNILSTDEVQCRVTSGNGCLTSGMSNTLSVTVQPMLTPSVTIQMAGGPFCAGSAVVFTATPVNQGLNPSYQWRVNNVAVGTTLLPTYTYAGFNDGDRMVCVLTNNTTQCLTSTTAVSNEIAVNITTPADPQVTVTASATNIYGGTPVTFKAMAQTPVAAYQWQINNVNYGTNAPTFTTKALKNGDRITCIVTAANQCAVPATSQAIIMDVLQPPEIKIPNAFTPNGDGVNDVWEITELSFYPECVVKIFNRNGLMLYQSKGYTNAWDGTFNGKKVAVGVYYYIISTTPLNSLQRNGYVTVIR